MAKHHYVVQGNNHRCQLVAALNVIRFYGRPFPTKREYEELVLLSECGGSTTPVSEAGHKKLMEKLGLRVVQGPLTHEFIHKHLPVHPVGIIVPAVFTHNVEKVDLCGIHGEAGLHEALVVKSFMDEYMVVNVYRGQEYGFHKLLELWPAIGSTSSVSARAYILDQ